MKYVFNQEMCATISQVGRSEGYEKGYKIDREWAISPRQPKSSDIDQASAGHVNKDRMALSLT